MNSAPAPGNHDGRELGGIDVGERDVDRARAPRLLHVGVEVRLEVVHDELDRPGRRRRDVRLVPGLDEAELDVHRLEILGSVTREDQDPGHEARLLDRDGLREVPRLVDVQPAQARDPIREELQREDREHDLQEGRRLRDVDDVVRVVLDVLVAVRRDRDDVGAAGRTSWMFETILS